MDRTGRSGGEPSDVAVADPSASELRRSGRDSDTIYRRPPASAASADQSGSAWFGDEAEQGGPDRPAHGPGTPPGYSRTSFGFGDGPISPVRQAGAAGAAAPEDVPAPDVITWPPPTRVDAPDLERVPGGPVVGPLAAGPLMAGTTPEPPDSTGELRARRGVGSPSAPRPSRGESTGEQLPVRTTRTPGETTGEQRVTRASHAETTGEQRAVRALRGETTGDQRAAHREMPPPVADPFRPRQSRLVTAGIVVLSAIVLLAGAAVGAMYLSGSDGRLESVLELGAGDATSRTVTAPLDDRTKASFEVLAATNRVTVTIGELGEDLYRISTPEDAGILPRPVIRNDDVKLQVTQDGDGIGGEIEVVLAARVQWSLRFSGYSEEQNVDLSNGTITDLAMVGASRRTALSLPRPSGTVPVRITAAVEELTVRSPAGSPVRVNVAAGATKVVAGSRTLDDVPAGSTLTPKDWAAPNRYDVTAAARITALTVVSA